MVHRSILVKILPQQYVAEFLDGNMFLNTNEYFGTIDESDIVRYDPHDGIVESRQVETMEVRGEDDEVWLTVPTVGPMPVRNRLSKFQNILCLYTITDLPNEEFNDLNLKFGDTAIVILKYEEFLRRILHAAKLVDKPVLYGSVEYVDRGSHDGSMGAFKKFSELQYQHEYRFVFDKGNGEACRLIAGNFRDITVVIKSVDIPAFRREMLTT